MNSRKRILSRTVNTPVTSVLRHRRTRGGPVVERGKEAKVIAIRNGEDIVLSYLRGCPAEIQQFRHGEYLHVSDLLGKCVRKIALSEKLKVSMPAGRISDSMALVHAQGHAIHDYVKQKIAKGHPGKMYGRWACLCGNTVTVPMIKNSIPNIACNNCGSVPYNYRELEVFDDEWMLVGSPDIVLYIDEWEVYYPIEVKSINYEEWKDLARPKPDHVLQVLFYWLMMRRKGYSVPDQVSILYVSKGFIFKSPFKEFIVKPKEELSRLDPYIEEAIALKDMRSRGEVPPRTICSSLSSKDAKECHLAHPCFQHA